MINALSTLAIIHCAIIAVITSYGLTTASGDWIAGVCGAGIIVATIYRGMGAACNRVAGISGTGVAVVTILASDI